jgi:hypothetical protein
VVAPEAVLGGLRLPVGQEYPAFPIRAGVADVWRVDLEVGEAAQVHPDNGIFRTRPPFGSVIGADHMAALGMHGDKGLRYVEAWLERMQETLKLLGTHGIRPRRHNAPLAHPRRSELGGP